MSALDKEQNIVDAQLIHDLCGARVEPARVPQSGTRALVLEHITNRCAPHDCIVILDMAKSFCARVRADLVQLGFKAEVAQFASQALAADLRSQLVNLVDKALWWSAGKKACGLG